MAVFCDRCRDTGTLNANELSAAEDAAEFFGARAVPPTEVPCESCPSCAECGRYVREHGAYELVGLIAVRDGCWELPACGRDVTMSFTLADCGAELDRGGLSLESQRRLFAHALRLENERGAA